MLRRRALAAAASGLLATATFTLAGTPAAAGPAPAPAPAPVASTVQTPPGMLAAMQRDLGLTAAEARTRLANEAAAAPVEKNLRRALGADFAGSWTSGDTARLVVATTDRADVRRITAAGAEAKLVAHGLSALDAAKSALDKAGPTAAVAPLRYVDVRTNSVVVETADPAAARAYVARSGADRALVRVVKSDVRPRALADLRGGDPYYINRSGRCSIGFPITRGSQSGFVTAGHCGTAGASVTDAAGSSIGSFQGSSFPGNDYAWVAAGSSWTPRPWVKGPSGNVTVSGSTLAAVGASVCRSGSTTGWHCGTIQQHNTSVTYPEGTITGVSRTTVCAEPGDSGGSYISGSQAQGVTSGGSGNCSSGGETYFQPVNEILQAYGLTLVTDGGTTPPPGGSCSSAQQRYDGSLTSGGVAVQPGGSYYQSTTSGTHTGCLAGPSGADFDLYLQKWNGSTWATVAQGTTPAADETLTYNGTAGYYRYQVHAYSGSGAYTLGLSRP
ncbi:S1 family peptidase [Streptomyces sp. HUAS MG47]|uniref:S1 family peptidase n=1 Tax=Streptomyces solicamelliae TaxID=3231716 RepID=UPI003877FD7F